MFTVDTKKHARGATRTCSPVLVTPFLPSMAGLFSNKKLHNYVHGSGASAHLHGSTWNMNEGELKTMLKAAEKAHPSQLTMEEAPTVQPLNS